jgi:hypothetical protein
MQLELPLVHAWIHAHPGMCIVHRCVHLNSLEFAHTYMLTHTHPRCTCRVLGAYKYHVTGMESFL